MRSLSAASNKPRPHGRASAGRRSAPVRAPSGRLYGKRARDRRNLLSRFLSAFRNAPNPRRPAVIASATIALIGVIVFLFVAGYVRRATAAVHGAAAMMASDAGLAISAIHLAGNRYEAPGKIYQQLGFAAGDSIFAADPQAARDRLEELPWIKTAEISRRYPDTVYVHIVEKVPFGLWQSDHGLYAVERDGTPIAQVDAQEFRRLPFFYGDQPDRASDLVTAIRKHHAVSARMKAMQRVGGRRWNLLLDDGVLVKLPEGDWQKELNALERLIVDNGVLERDIAEIDLRSHDNYIFVLRHPAPRKNARGEPT